MTRIASDVAGLPSIAHVPEEPTSTLLTDRDSISWRNKACAMGDLHRLPVHTNKILKFSSHLGSGGTVFAAQM
jgi:hypothetical protein